MYSCFIGRDESRGQHGIQSSFKGQSVFSSLSLVFKGIYAFSNFKSTRRSR